MIAGVERFATIFFRAGRDGGVHGGFFLWDAAADRIGFNRRWQWKRRQTKAAALRTVVGLFRSISAGVSGANFVTVLLDESCNGIEGR